MNEAKQPDDRPRSPTAPPRTRRTWFISGASRGFGRALTIAALRTGDRVIATARNPAALADLEAQFGDSIMPLRLDVTRSEEIEEVVGVAEEQLGGIDILVNNAGYGYLAAVEEGEDPEIRAQFETNFFGLAELTRAALPAMRRRRSGFIVNMSSNGGFVGLPASGYYAATKFAVEGLTEALYREVRPLGIRVMMVEPGAFRTDWAGRSLRQCPTFIPDYEDTAGVRRRSIAANHGHQRGDPALAAQAILAAVNAPEPPLRLVLGPDALDTVRGKLERVVEDHRNWEDVTISTDMREPAPLAGAAGQR